MDDPLAPFLTYLKMRDFQFPLQPFLWLQVNGKLSSCAWFIWYLWHFFDTSIAGHSLHAGGATSLTAAGVPPASIQHIGHWHLDTWEHYICKNPVLLQALLLMGICRFMTSRLNSVRLFHLCVHLYFFLHFFLFLIFFIPPFPPFLNTPL